MTVNREGYTMEEAQRRIKTQAAAGLTLQQATATLRAALDAMDRTTMTTIPALERITRAYRDFNYGLDKPACSCPNCCWPIPWSYQAHWAECWLCGYTISAEQIEDRSRWRRLLDQLTGDVTCP